MNDREFETGLQAAKRLGLIPWAAFLSQEEDKLKGKTEKEQEIENATERKIQPSI